ncbi:MAG: tol-pal system YbgF family protein [Nitrospiria bacterium]
MPYKIRVRKEESVEVQIAHWSESMVNWLAANVKGVLLMIGVVALIGIALIIVKNMSLDTEGKAAILEKEASGLLHDPIPLPEPIEEGEDPPEILTQEDRYQKSVTLYKEILEKYPSTSTAAIAQYEIGNVYFELEEFDSAIEGYNAFIQTYPEQKDLISIIQLKLGYLHQRKGDEQSARDYFRSLYESEGAWNRDQAGFELARSLEVEGKEGEAKTLYEKISEDFTESPWSAEATARVSLLSPPSETDSPSADPSTKEVKSDKVKKEGPDQGAE